MKKRNVKNVIHDFKISKIGLDLMKMLRSVAFNEHKHSFEFNKLNLFDILL